MCGRYLRRSDKQRIAEAFRLGTLPDSLILPPDYNVAPTSMQPVIRLNRDTGGREIALMRQQATTAALLREDSEIRDSAFEQLQPHLSNGLGQKTSYDCHNGSCRRNRVPPLKHERSPY